jgi:hypothetical protein
MSSSTIFDRCTPGDVLMKRVQWSAWLWLLLVGCSPNLSIPKGAQISCGSDGKCPDGLVCQASIGLCVSPDNLGGSPPALVSNAVSPEFVKAGRPVTVTFGSTHPLVDPPVVWAEIRDQRVDFALQSSTGGNYVFAYTPDGGENEGQATVFVNLTDEGGNIANGLTAGKFVFDFTPPGVSFAQVEYLAAPDNPLHGGVTAARQGTEIRVLVQADEALSDAGTPVMTATNGNGAPLQFEYLPGASSGSQVTFRVVVDGGITGAPEVYVPTVSGWADPAGNVATTATFSDPAIRVRQSAPVLGVDQTQVVYVRSPWGNQVEEDVGGGVRIPAGPWFGLTPTDPLSPLAVLPPSTFANLGAETKQVRVWRDPAKKFLLGFVTPNVDGSWSRVMLSPVDNLVVYVSSLDEAGNESDAVPIDNAELVTTTLPNALGTFSVLQSTSLVSDTIVPNPDQSRLEDASLVQSTGAGDPLVAQSQRAWHQALAASTAPSARDGQAMAFDARHGALYLFGGGKSPNPPDVTDELWKWDGSRWAQLPKSGSWPGPRWYASMVYDSARDRLVLFGGKEQNTFLGDMWEFDGVKWTPITQTSLWPIARTAASMVYDSLRGRVVLYGGSLGQGGTGVTCGSVTCYDPSVWEWDGFTWQRLTPSSVPPTRWLASMAFDRARGRAVLFGGYSESACGGSNNVCADTWEWNGTSWSNPTPATHPDPLEGPGMAYDFARGVTVLYGGDSPIAPAQRSQVWEWDGTTWSPKVAGRVTPPGGVAQLVYLPNQGRTFLFGDEAALNNDSWNWDGSTWTRQTVPTNLPGEGGFAYAYDSARDRVEVFGGHDGAGNILGALWEFDGASWTRRPDAGVWPPSSDDIAMAYDPTLARTVMINNRWNINTGVADVWEWDGNTWTNATPASGGPIRPVYPVFVNAGAKEVEIGTGTTGVTEVWEWSGSWTNRTPGSGSSPSPRTRASAAYDPARGVVVLFGGMQPDGGPLGDLWEWNGASWAPETPSGAQPSPRMLAQMAYDPNAGGVVLFGGTNSWTAPYQLSDQALWSWDGTGWTNQTPLDGGAMPSARYEGAMIFDSTRNRIEVFGGDDRVPIAQLTTQNLWVLDEPTPRQPAIQADLTAGAGTVGPITGLRVRAECGGSNPPFPGGTDGAELFAWSNAFAEQAVPGWRQLTAANSVSVGSASPFLSPFPAPMIDWQATTATEAARYVRSRDEQVSVQCRPAGSAASKAESRAAMKYVETHVKYSTLPFQ